MIFDEPVQQWRLKWKPKNMLNCSGPYLKSKQTKIVSTKVGTIVAHGLYSVSANICKLHTCENMAQVWVGLGECYLI